MTFRNRKLASILAAVMAVAFAFAPSTSEAYALNDIYCDQTELQLLDEDSKLLLGEEVDESADSAEEASDQAEMVLDEVEATDSEESQLEADADNGENLLAEAEVQAENSGEDYDGFIVILEEDAPAKAVEEVNEEVAEIDEPEVARELVEDEVYYADSIETVEEIADTDVIKAVEPNYARSLCAVPNDPYYSKNSRFYGLVKANWAWNRNIKGQGLRGNKTPTVAVIDSGLAGSGSNPKNKRIRDINYHNVVTGKNFYGRGKYSKTFTDDDNGHGTFICSEIAAIQNNRAGTAGLMPNVRLCPLKITDRYGRAYSADIVRAIYYAVDNGADVINICMGSPQPSVAEENACKYAERHGVIVVTASGNTGKLQYVYPAAYSSTISVGAVDANGRYCSFSTRNKKVDAVAPGQGIYGSGIKSCGRMSGTSMAAPYVSALAAMAKSADNTITTREFRKILTQTSTDMGAAGRDNYYGYGIVNFKVVYKYITGQLIDVNSLKIRLKTRRYVYDGKVKKPAVAISRLDRGKDFKVSYSGNVKVGRARVKVRGLDDYTGTAIRYFEIVPAGTSIKLLTPERGALKVKWNMQKVQTSGYQLKYSIYSSMKASKTLTITRNDTTLGKIKYLDAGKKYYVQIRTYKNVNGKKYYSKWSSKKTAIVK